MGCGVSTSKPTSGTAAYLASAAEAPTAALVVPTSKPHKAGHYTIIISSGTAKSAKVHVGVVNGFALLKGDASNKVDFVLMAEGGWVVDDAVMRGIGAYGLPPMATLLDAPEMNDPERVSWTV